MDALKKEFDHQLAGIAWSLWKELGVAGTERFHENVLIQPEELIILTILISEYDPRLRDEALDWCSRYHELISVSRLRFFLKELDPHTLRSFSQFVAALNSISSAKWPNAAEAARFKIKISGKSLLPPLGSPSLLMLRLRRLFGPGAKADILTCFLTRNGMRFSAANLVEIGYSKRCLMTALDHLVAAGVLAVTNVQNKKNYELKRSKELQVVVGKLPKVAPPWNKILQVIIAIRAMLSEIQNSSEITKGVILRNCLSKIESLLPTFIAPILFNRPRFEQELHVLNQFIYTFRKRLEGLYFVKTDIHLLSHPTTLYKRHLVLDLFSVNAES